MDFTTASRISAARMTMDMTFRSVDQTENNVDEGNPYYKKACDAGKKVVVCLSEKPIRFEKLQSALNNDETARMLLKHNLEESFEFVFQNKHLLEDSEVIAFMQESMSTMGAMGDSVGMMSNTAAGNWWDAIWNDASLDMDQRAAALKAMQEMYAHVSKDFMTLLLKCTTPKTVGNISGVEVNFKRLKEELDKILEKFGLDGTERLYTSPNKAKAEEFAKSMGLDPAKCVIENEDGSFSVINDMTGIFHIRAALEEMEAKQNSRNPKYLEGSEFNGLEKIITSAGADIENSMNKAAQLTVAGREQHNDMAKQLLALISADVEQLKTLGSRF